MGMLKNRFGILVSGSALVLVAACTAGPVPDSGPGFDDYTQYEIDRANREAALTGDTGAAAITGEELAGVGIGGAPAGGPIGNANSNNPDISDEQDFGAVSSRETIESDAERRAQQAAAYQLAEVEALPERTSAGPNIVQYALETTNSVGQPIYSRSAFSGQSRFLRNCAEYQSPDAAQMDFLARGGPERDRRGIDPDGDGFACGWDPAPYRVVLSAPAPEPAASGLTGGEPLSAISLPVDGS